MENKINIAKILRDCPKGTKLYSPLFGKCECIEVVNSKYPIVIKAQSVNGAGVEDFTENGRFIDGFEGAECLLFPSAKMRCWDKFFKRGDIVYNLYSKMYAVFECWANDDYTEFNTTINYYDDHTFGGEEVCTTDSFVKATDKQRVEFIEAAEKHYGDKYNPETLHVESVKVVEPKCPFKPFQKVLVRDDGEDNWRASFFSHYERGSKFPYVTTAGGFRQCLFYEGYEDLLGTTDAPF